MAHKAVAAKWLLDKKFLKTAFTEFSWGKPNYYDVGLTIEDNNGIIFSGQGTDILPKSLAGFVPLKGNRRF